jgi:hypothetical protein
MLLFSGQIRYQLPGHPGGEIVVLFVPQEILEVQHRQEGDALRRNYARHFRRATPAVASKPVPKRRSVDGSGVAPSAGTN